MGQGEKKRVSKESNASYAAQRLGAGGTKSSMCLIGDASIAWRTSCEMCTITGNSYPKSLPEHR